MQSPAEAIREIESHFDTESLELQISYCETMAAAHPLTARYQRLLELYTEALRMQGILVRMQANLHLGLSSPYINDADLMNLDAQEVYEAYSQYRLGIDPNAEPSRRTEARSKSRAGISQRSPAEPRQPAETPRPRLWATKQLAPPKRIASAIAKRDSASSIEVGSNETIPTTATSKPVTSKPHEPTPPQPATLTPIGHWPLVIGNCGSTMLTTGGSGHRTAAVPAARRIVPDHPARRHVRRSTTPRHTAGPGGACLRQAA